MNTTMERISRFTFVLICSLMLCLPMMGKKSKYRIEVEAPEAHLFNGFGVGVDLVGPIMKVAGGRFSNMEALARANLLEKYFPVFELGIGNCKREGKEQNTLLRSISIDTDGGIFHGHLTVMVNDLSSLNILIRKISAVKGVKHVERINQ